MMDIKPSEQEQPMSQVIAVYAGEEPPEAYDASIFLAGPTPREAITPSWRPAALSLLEKLVELPPVLAVFIPEPRGGQRQGDYEGQIAWEDRYLSIADVIAFWVPREMVSMPALTTNVEFGRYEASGRIVLGFPPEAVHIKYLESFARDNGAPVVNTLQDTLAAALERIGAGAHRSGGERDVPLLLWQNQVFAAWLAGQQAAGNRLEGGRIAWISRPGPGGRYFFWAFAAQVFVASEGRIKDNEVVIGRPDVATVVAYRRADSIAEAQVVLVREFHTPARSASGFVLELPGGSDYEQTDPRELARSELAQETGLSVDPGRLIEHQSRQLVATMSAHCSHLFSVELTESEMDALVADVKIHGQAAESERTCVEIRRFGELLSGAETDWSTLGQIAQALQAATLEDDLFG
jgi:8-oxo-dGTP pyrophosphatase MutT (NUDIX family)